MKEFKTQQGHLVFEIQSIDCLVAGFGYVCDNCNNDLFEKNSDKAYYIPVLNQVFCKECYDEWNATSEFYEEDMWFEHEKAEDFRKLYNL